MNKKNTIPYCIAKDTFYKMMLHGNFGEQTPN